MNAAIVDTDVVSRMFKGDTRAFDYITARLLGISFMTLAELERWSLERCPASQPRIVSEVCRGIIRCEEKRAADPKPPGLVPCFDTTS